MFIFIFLLAYCALLKGLRRDANGLHQFLHPAIHSDASSTAQKPEGCLFLLQCPHRDATHRPDEWCSHPSQTGTNTSEAKELVNLRRLIMICWLTNYYNYKYMPPYIVTHIPFFLGGCFGHQKGFDVFNALDLMDNKNFLEKLKFGIGDGNLQYYLYNWKCPPMDPEKVRISFFFFLKD